MSFVSNNETSEVSEYIEGLYRNSEIEDLQVRDHIITFLGVEPFYFALDISSADLLEQVDGCTSDDEVRRFASKFIFYLTERTSKSLIASEIDLDRLIKDELAVLLPNVIELRSRELSDSVIPFTTKTSPKKQSLYCMIELYKTTHGRRILEALGHGDLEVISEKKWLEIKEAFSEAGFDITQNLEEIEHDQWFDYVYSMSTDEKKEYDSPELKLLQSARFVRDKLRSTNQSTRINALETLVALKTCFCNDLLLSLIEDGSEREVSLATEIIVNTGTSYEESVLSQYLKEFEGFRRTKVAQALSQLYSFGFQLAALPAKRSPDLGTSDFSKLMKILDVSDYSYNTWIFDAKRTDESIQAFVIGRIVRSASKKKKLFLLERLEEFEKEFARIVLLVLYNENDPDIKGRATEIILRVWPSHSDVHYDDEDSIVHGNDE